MNLDMLDTLFPKRPQALFTEADCAHFSGSMVTADAMATPAKPSASFVRKPYASALKPREIHPMPAVSIEPASDTAAQPTFMKLWRKISDAKPTLTVDIPTQPAAVIPFAVPPVTSTPVQPQPQPVPVASAIPASSPRDEAPLFEEIPFFPAQTTATTDAPLVSMDAVHNLLDTVKLEDLVQDQTQRLLERNQFLSHSINNLAESYFRLQREATA